MFKILFGYLKRRFRHGFPSKLSAYPSNDSEKVYVVDGLHQQFLKEELIERCSRGISVEKRQLYAGLMSVADGLSYENLSIEEMMPKLEDAGLNTIISLTKAIDLQTLNSIVLTELRGLISYWEEPHLELYALPVVEKALTEKLGLNS